MFFFLPSLLTYIKSHLLCKAFPLCCHQAESVLVMAEVEDLIQIKAVKSQEA